MSKLIMEFTDLPFPPSVNEAYLTLLNRRRVGSSKLKRFKHEMGIWTVNRRSILADVREQMDERSKYRLELVFKLPYKRLFTIAGAPKSFDTSNRIKAMEDALFEALGIDDRHVWEVLARKELYGNPSGESFTEARLFRLGDLLS